MGASGGTRRSQRSHWSCIRVVQNDQEASPLPDLRHPARRFSQGAEARGPVTPIDIEERSLEADRTMTFNGRWRLAPQCHEH